MASNGIKRKALENGAGPAIKKKVGHWSLGLKASMDDPELQVEKDEKIVIIKDKYPKAKHHYLVLPHESIASLKKLTSEHLPLLRHIEMKGRELIKSLHSDVKFRYGYHAIPSMSHIHMHVISQDFNSARLKTKQHWNSFTTDYFIDSQDIIKMIEEDGKFLTDTSKHADLLKKDLKCHCCDQKFTTMPKLKQHILIHDK